MSAPLRLLLLHPWGPDYMDASARDTMQAHLGPTSRIEVDNLGKEAQKMPWPHADSRARMLERAQQAERAGYDGLIIGCAADPFLAEIQAPLSIPVTAPSQAAAWRAAQIGPLGVVTRRLAPHFSALIPNQDNWQDTWQRRFAGYGVERILLDSIFVDRHPDPEELVNLTAADPALLARRILHAMAQALQAQGPAAFQRLKSAGAEVAYMGCTFWSQSLWRHFQLKSAFALPVINPLGNAALHSEALARGRG